MEAIVSIPTQVPTTLTAGNTWRWTLDLSSYPADTWTATVYFTNSSAIFSAVGAASGTAHAFTVAAATTATRKAGRYTWVVRVTDGTIVETVDEGATDVEADPASSATRDTRTWARKTLEAVEAFLAGNATTAQASMTIRDRSISRWSLSELTKWRDQLRAEVRTEESAENHGLGRDIKVRFGRG
jgi:hypothetical protein